MILKLKKFKDYITRTKAFIFNNETKQLFKTDPLHFTRNRKLGFENTVLIMFKLLRKSLSFEMVNIIESLNSVGGQIYERFTSIAFIQNRHKIKPDLFYRLNQEIIDEFYTDNELEVKLYNGMRLLAIDGSSNLLPPHKSLIAYFGSTSNQYKESANCIARVSVMYDVLNELILDSQIAPFSTSEVTLGKDHLKHLSKNDLVLMDRGYPSFEIFHYIINKGANFVIRCKKDYSVQSKAFYLSNQKDVIINVYPNSKNGYDHLSYDKNTELKLRFIRVALENGEIEILITSLLDEETHSTESFKDIYNKRWGIETFYDFVKNIIEIENYSGTNEKFIKQEFYCAMYIANMHSLSIKDIEEEIVEKYKHRKLKYKINKSISLGFMRENILQIMIENDNLFMEKFQKLIVDFVIPNRKHKRSKDKYRTRAKPKGLQNQKKSL